MLSLYAQVPGVDCTIVSMIASKKVQTGKIASYKKNFKKIIDTVYIYIFYFIYTHLIRKYITIDIEDKYTDGIICTCIYIERKDG